MRNPFFKYLVAITLVVGAVCAPPIGTSDGPVQAASASDLPITDISGTWNSSFGPVTLKVEGLDSDGQAVISGSWHQGATKIVFGRFQPRTVGSALSMEYYVPAMKHYGYAEFKLDVTRTVLTGKYYETDQTGDWVLTRPAGFRPSTLGKLNTITDLGQNKRSTVLTNVVGAWDSTFGLVELESSGYSLGVLLKGKFTRPDGKVGKIVSGTFVRDPKGGLLKIQYATPWNNRTGSGTFRPDSHIANRQLLGIYEENGEKGQWVLSRPLGK